MSHFTTLQTRLVEERHLKQALADLGYVVEQGPIDIRGFEGNTMAVEFRVATARSDYHIGFRKKGAAYEVVADWWGVKDVKPDALLNQLAQRYAYHAARETLAAQHFELVEEKVGPDQTIHLTLRRMV